MLVEDEVVDEVGESPASCGEGCRGSSGARNFSGLKESKSGAVDQKRSTHKVMKNGTLKALTVGYKSWCNLNRGWFKAPLRSSASRVPNGPLKEAIPIVYHQQINSAEIRFGK